MNLGAAHAERKQKVESDAAFEGMWEWDEIEPVMYELLDNTQQADIPAAVSPPSERSERCGRLRTHGVAMQRSERVSSFYVNRQAVLEQRQMAATDA